MLPYLSEKEKASLKQRKIRFRTLGGYPQTGGLISDANTLEGIVTEMIGSKNSEREGRLLNKDQTGSMKKKNVKLTFRDKSGFVQKRAIQILFT
jgi:sulfate adenylyltransferase subunit 2